MNHLLSNKVNYLETSPSNLGWFTEGNNVTGYITMVDGYKQISWRSWELPQDQWTTDLYSFGRNYLTTIAANTETEIYRFAPSSTNHGTIFDVSVQISFLCSDYVNITSDDLIVINLIAKGLYSDDDSKFSTYQFKLNKSLINTYSLLVCSTINSFVQRWSISITSTKEGQILAPTWYNGQKPLCYMRIVNMK